MFIATPLNYDPNTACFSKGTPQECTEIMRYKSGRCIDFRAKTITGEWIYLHCDEGRKLYKKYGQANA